MTSIDGRYSVNNGEKLPKPNYHEELIESLTRINLYNPPVHTCSTGWRLQGFFQGPTSIAYLFYKLFLLYPDLQFKGQSLMDWAQAYLELTKFGPKQPVNSDHCGIANETLASLALNAVINKDSSLALQLCSYRSVINRNEEPGSDEWLYGRAGYLYYLRLIKATFGSHSSTGSTINVTIDLVVERILRSPKPWIWHGKTYLGAAHGSIGIIAQLVLSSASGKTSSEPVIDELLKLQFESGNFPLSLGHSDGPDELVQFCHGGPGFVLALKSIRGECQFMTSRINKAIAAAQSDTWQRGLLTKTPCLCHGIAGNALALRDDEQFEYFLAHMTTAQLKARNWLADAGHTDRFAGLFGGEAGRAWVFAVADKALQKTCIGFNDL